MNVLVLAITLALVGFVVLVLAAPLRAAAERSRADRPAEADVPPARGELEAAREAKYREIRDAELDYRTGKLSQEDYEAIDAALRAEALVILDGFDRLEDGEAEGDGRGEAPEELRPREP